jgi:hypothetical protein
MVMVPPDAGAGGDDRVGIHRDILFDRGLEGLTHLGGAGLERGGGFDENDGPSREDAGLRGGGDTEGQHHTERGDS